MNKKPAGSLRTANGQTEMGSYPKNSPARIYKLSRKRVKKYWVKSRINNKL